MALGELFADRIRKMHCLFNGTVSTGVVLLCLSLHAIIKPFLAIASFASLGKSSVNQIKVDLSLKAS
jgi:hypothetical protein